jgi:BirA family transcriptional regulator, biotin operon repressor / biotin---[acetyl-CoA-carboxylase] ligase
MFASMHEADPPVSSAEPLSSAQLHRAPLAETALRTAILSRSDLWSELTVVGSTGSTNEDLLAAARAGAPPGSVLVAEEQTRGRGRLDRVWQSEPGAALTFSVLLRPAGVPAGSRGWLPLLAGVAVAAGLRAQAGLGVSLKWPNDVLVGQAKLAGILAEQAGTAIVVGIGLNVGQRRDELPSEQATSVWLEGATGADRGAILAAVLREFERWYRCWTSGPQPGDASASGLRAEYLEYCATVGKDVRVELPGGSVLTGRAIGVDGVGRLLVSTIDGVNAVSAGDVVHVR